MSILSIQRIPKYRAILFLGLLLMGNGVNAQLDSLSANLVVTQEPMTDSLGITDSVDVFNVQLSVNDFDLVGEVIVTVYEGASNYPIDRLQFTRAEAISAGIVSGDTAVMKFYRLVTTESYIFETRVTNDIGGHLPKLTTNYN